MVKRIRRYGVWIAGILLSLLLTARGGQPVFAASGATDATVTTALSECGQEESVQEIQIDDGAIPLADLPAAREIPPELILMTGGLLFVGVTVYTHHAGTREQKRAPDPDAEVHKYE